MDRQAPLIVITGPTGSGKTAIALELVGRYPLEVISADSMQVYRHMDIATAKPTADEQRVLPHHLIDVVEPDEKFNAGMFARKARAAIEGILSRGAVPLVVGGTGLYIKALVYGLAPAPPGSEAVRSVLRSIADEKGVPHLWRFLNRLDPEAAGRLDANDRVRIVRALEVILLTGRRLSAIHREHGFDREIVPARIVCVMPERGELYRRIDARVVTMVESGLVEETRRLLDMGFSPRLRSMQTLAYRHIVEYLGSRIGLDEAVGLIQRDTRRYAKRQITWMRSHYDPGSFLPPDGALDLAGRMLDGSPRLVPEG